MIESKICSDLGIKYPIFQGGMAYIANAKLAAAVSNAGGLGIIAGMNFNGEQLRAEIRKCKQLTDKPFGVNVMLMSPFAAEVSDVVIEEGVPVIATGAGNPMVYMKKWIDAGIKVIPVVASVALAKMLERRGAYAVVAEGCESGGHIGETTTMALVPEVASAVSIPVIAAGGIADGRGMAAAFMLGACGIQMGTRFLVADECDVNDTYKDMVLRACDIDTIAMGRRLGHPVRVIKNSFTREMSEKEYNMNVSDEELDAMGKKAMKKAVLEGDEKNGSFVCGQIAGLVKERMPAKQIIEEICSEAEVLLKGAMKWVK